MRKQRRAYALITRKGKVLLVKNRRGRWTLPGGRAQGNESLRAAAKREVKEEMGITIELKARVSGDHIRHHTVPCAGCVAFAASIKKSDPRPRGEIVEIAWVDTDKALKRLRSYRRSEVRRILAKIR
ncbi:MAG: NUDIX domain-containing protein [Actinobacteria bacterium]|nr:NUDIX domain-containing protein [Actinomycetota bacterium]